MKVKRWDAAEYITPRIAVEMFLYSLFRGPRSTYITIRAIVRAIGLKLGLAKPYEWVELKELGL